MNDLNLNLLRRFRASAEMKDFSTAANFLGTSSGSLSAQIDELEKFLGVQLFLRKGHKKTTNLTREGKKVYGFYALLDQALTEVRENENHLLKDDILRIKVKTTPGLSSYIFSDFYVHNIDALDKYVLDIDSSQSNNKVKGDEIIIRSDIIHSDDVVIEDLLAIDFCLYASQDYISQNGKPEKFSDLTSHRLISSNLLYYYDSYSPIPKKAQLNSDFKQVVISNDILTNLKLCENNVGIIELPEIYPGTEKLTKIVLSDYSLKINICIGYKKNILEIENYSHFIKILKRHLEMKKIDKMLK